MMWVLKGSSVLFLVGELNVMQLLMMKGRRRRRSKRWKSQHLSLSLSHVWLNLTV